MSGFVEEAGGEELDSRIGDFLTVGDPGLTETDVYTNTGATSGCDPSHSDLNAINEGSNTQMLMCIAGALEAEAGASNVMTMAISIARL